MSTETNNEASQYDAMQVFVYSIAWTAWVIFF